MWAYYGNGSLTIEAAFVLPILLFLAASVMFFFQILLLQFEIGFCMNQVARKWAIYEPIAEEHSISDAEAISLAIADVDVRLKKLDAPIEYVTGSYLGLNYSDSEITDHDIDLQVKYYIRLPISFFGIQEWEMNQRAVSRKWTGYDPNENNTDGSYVFVTESGSAYHLSINCSYLNPSIHSTPAGTINQQRSKDGAKYKACKLCGNNKSSFYYITDYGDTYHTKINCSSLKRTIRRIKLEDAIGYHKCGKCG